jgi:hypothetical protein
LPSRTRRACRGATAHDTGARSDLCDRSDWARLACAARCSAVQTSSTKRTRSCGGRTALPSRARRACRGAAAHDTSARSDLRNRSRRACSTCPYPVTPPPVRAGATDRAIRGAAVRVPSSGWALRVHLLHCEKSSSCQCHHVRRPGQLGDHLWFAVRPCRGYVAVPGRLAAGYATAAQQHFAAGCLFEPPMPRRRPRELLTADAEAARA